nr:immunoglobulin light chain junction region [Macaca mulatta]
EYYCWLHYSGVQGLF